MPKEKVSKTGAYFSAHGCPVDLDVAFIIKRNIIHGENHANKIR